VLNLKFKIYLPITIKSILSFAARAASQRRRRRRQG
jgi:hypothetical protein